MTQPQSDTGLPSFTDENGVTRYGQFCLIDSVTREVIWYDASESYPGTDPRFYSGAFDDHGNAVLTRLEITGSVGLSRSLDGVSVPVDDRMYDTKYGNWEEITLADYDIVVTTHSVTLTRKPEAGPAPEDRAASKPIVGRTVEHFIIGIGDNLVVYISSDPSGRSDTFRVFAEEVGITGDFVLPRALLNRPFDQFHDGNVFYANIGTITVDDGTWESLDLQKYDIVEYSNRVTFTRK